MGSGGGLVCGVWVFEGGGAGRRGKGGAYSLLVMPARSFRSAPAQKHSSTSLARISTRVPCPTAPPALCPAISSSASRFTALISCESSERSWREMALRVRGLLRLRTRMWPRCGAGMLWVLRRVGDGAVE